MEFQKFFDPFGSALAMAGKALENEGQSIQNQTNLVKLGQAKEKLDLDKAANADVARSFQEFGTTKAPLTGTEKAGPATPGSLYTMGQGQSPSSDPLDDSISTYDRNIKLVTSLAQAESSRNPKLAEEYIKQAGTFLAGKDAAIKERQSLRSGLLNDVANTLGEMAESPEKAGAALRMLQMRHPEFNPALLESPQFGLKFVNGFPVFDPAAFRAASRTVMTAKDRSEEEHRKEVEAGEKRREVLEAKRIALSQREEDRRAAEHREAREDKKEDKAAKDEAKAAKDEVKQVHELQGASKVYNQASAEFTKSGGIKQTYETAERYVIDPKTGHPYPTTHFDAERDQSLVYSYIAAVHPQHRGSVAELKKVDQLTGVPQKIFQGIKGLVEGKELSPTTRIEMFNAIKEHFVTANELQRQREEATRFKLRMIKPDADSDAINALAPQYSIRGGDLGYFLQKHGD